MMREINSEIMHERVGPLYETLGELGGSGSGYLAGRKLYTTAAKSLFSIKEFMESATAPWGKQGLTVVGRALQKHAGRKDSVFESIKFSHKTGNKDALKILNKIITSENRVFKPAERGGVEIYDKVSGQGFGVSREGLFNGFRELPK